MCTCFPCRSWTKKEIFPDPSILQSIPLIVPSWSFIISDEKSKETAEKCRMAPLSTTQIGPLSTVPDVDAIAAWCGCASLGCGGLFQGSDRLRRFINSTACRLAFWLTCRCPFFCEVSEMEIRNAIFLIPFLIEVVLLRYFMIADLLIAEGVGVDEVSPVAGSRLRVGTSAGWCRDGSGGCACLHCLRSSILSRRR